MKKFLLGTAALISMFAGTALAADLPPVKAPVLKAPAPVASTWNGFYVGVNGGGAFGDTGASQTGLPLGNVTASGDYNLKHHLSGGLAGGQFGYNWQSDRWVWGLQADIDAADVKGLGALTGAGVAQRNGVNGFPGNFVNGGEKIDFLSTARLRVGALATDNVLLYGTGGLAFGNVKYNGQFHYATPEDYFAAGSSMRAGWTAGIGGEYRMSNSWSVSVEYLYFDLGKRRIVSDFGTPANPPFQSQFDFNTHGGLVRGALDYKFDWGWPVVGKY